MILSKLNYRLHIDVVRDNLVPLELAVVSGRVFIANVDDVLDSFV